MNVTVLIIASFPDSIIKFRGHLIKEMLEQGANVYVASPDLERHSVVKDQLLRLGATPVEITLSRTGMNPFRDIASLIRLIRLMHKIRPDIVLAYTIKPVIYGLLASRFSGVPHRYALITGLGYAFTAGVQDETRALMKRVILILYKVSLRYADKVFFQNRDDQFLFQRLGLVSATKPTIVLSGSGIDIAEYSNTSFPVGSVSFLMIARLLGDKGVREYVDAATRILNVHPQVQFHLVGWIDNNPDSVKEHEVAAWEKAGIRFHGRLDDVRPAIEACGVYVLPSYREGTPRTVLEAMAMGRPIITTDAPGCRETVVDGDNGFLVPIKSVEALVVAMTKFIESPELIPNMGARSRKMAEEKYNVHNVNAVMLLEMGIAP